MAELEVTPDQYVAIRRLSDQCSRTVIDSSGKGFDEDGYIAGLRAIVGDATAERLLQERGRPVDIIVVREGRDG